MMIAGLVKSSLIDYPGLIASVLFVPGCNYHCFYCHNYALISGNPPPPILPTDLILAFLQTRIGKLDGVVITGGEPTGQKDLPDFLGRIKSLGFRVKVDTNGSRPDVIEQLIKDELADFYAVDYKAPAARYEELAGAGAGAGPVQSTIGILLASSVDFQVRTTVIPQFSGKDMVVMAREIPPVPSYILNPYRKPVHHNPEDQSRVDQIPKTREQLHEFAQLMKPWQPHASA